MSSSANRADVERILTLINNNDLSALKSSDFEMFQYQGFDPIKLIMSLYSVKSTKNISDKDFTDDVLKMVAIGIIKGSVNDHNIKKMSDEGQEGIHGLVSKYGIKMGGGRGQGSNVITFPRVMATFPDIAVRMVTVIGPKEFPGSPLQSNRLPPYMQVQVFPAVIPKSISRDAKNMLLTASLCYSIDQSVQISQIKEPNLRTLASDQGNFTQVGHNSPVPNEEVRKRVFNSLSLSADYSKIASVLETYKSQIDPDFTILSKGEFIAAIVGE